jgi:diguanylate cyclase (GGDEF)-like protein/PAS domain S-box-containing protein
VRDPSTSEKAARKSRRARQKSRRARPPAPLPDIAERSRMWQALLESEDRYRAAFDHAPVGIMHTSVEDDRILRVNARLAEMLGYTESELLDMTTVDLRHPDGHSRNRRRNRSRALSGEIDSYSSERLFKRKDGSPLWVHRTVSLARDVSGKPLYFIRIIMDVGQRKQAEEVVARERALLRTIIDSLPDYIYVKDTAGRFQLGNEAWLKARGRTSEEVLGKSVYELFANDLAASLAAEDQAIIDSGKPLVDAEQRVVVRARDGTLGDERWSSKTKVPMRDAAGNVSGIIGISRDITENRLSARRREMEHAVTQVLAESTTVAEAMPRLLRMICQAMNWAYGARWVGTREGIYRAEYWADFEPAFEPDDEEHWRRQGMQGSMVLLHRAWQLKEPTWIVDLAHHETFRRRISARKFGLHGAFAFPITAGAEVIGIMEFFGREARQPDEMLLRVARAIGSQIGQFIQRKEAEYALRKSEERYRDVFEASPLPMWVWDDKKLVFLAVNEAAINHYGYTREEFLRMSVRDIWAPGEQARYEQSLRGRAQVQTLNLQRRHRTKDGRVIDVEATARQFLQDGHTVWLTLVNDVTERKRAEAALLQSEEQFRQLAGNIPQVFWITDVEQKEALYISPAAENLLGWCVPLVRARPRLLIEAVHKEDRRRVREGRKFAKEGGYDETYRIVRPDGSMRWVRDRAFPVYDASNTVYRIAGITEDITDRKEAEERLMHLAHYDVLTRLPNRVLFYDRLKQALAQAKRNQWVTGVMFIDLDRFKNVNDTLGHAVGDKLLQQVSERLAASVRTGDTVGRLGGDEFAIVLLNLSNAQDANLVAQKIMASFKEPFRLAGVELYATASIGITLYPDDSTEQETLIKNADAAMYRAKEVGRNSCRFYAPEMNARALELLSLENSLRRALERDEFVLYYQPKASIADGRIVGVEALLRWQHPDRGLVSPGEFMPLLEETGLIVPVGEWVLKSVCEQIMTWGRAGIARVPVAVNCSPRQFASRDFGDTIRRILDERAVDPRLIEIEITESSLMTNLEETARILNYVGDLGVGLSIDDFGTGYSSLAYLKRFPFDALKVDRSFVKDLTTDADDATITRALISMAHNLGLKVVAEGVETEAQLAFLVEHGCDEIQGFYFSRPLIAEECGAWLREGRHLSRSQD